MNGVTNIVYFQAWTNSERYDIVDFSGALLIQSDKKSKKDKTVVKDIATQHKGKGKFELELDSENYTYRLKINLGTSGKSVERDLVLIGTEFNEINFHITNENKVLDNSDILKIDFYPNSLVSSESVYVLTITLKEIILYSQQLQF